MRYRLSYWNKGDIVVVDTPRYRNHFFIFIKIRASFSADTDIDGVRHHDGMPRLTLSDLAVLYCINDGRTLAIHGSYLREPKEQ